MSDTADYQKLAARVLDLWQEQLTLMAQDPEYKMLGQEWLTPFQQALGPMQPPSNCHPTQQPSHQDHDTTEASTGTRQSNGPQTTAHTSGQRDDTLRQLADTLRQFNERLDRLEKNRPPANTGGKGNKTGT